MQLQPWTNHKGYRKFLFCKGDTTFKCYGIKESEKTWCSAFLSRYVPICSKYKYSSQFGGHQGYLKNSLPQKQQTLSLPTYPNQKTSVYQSINQSVGSNFTKSKDYQKVVGFQHEFANHQLIQLGWSSVNIEILSHEKLACYFSMKLLLANKLPKCVAKVPPIIRMQNTKSKFLMVLQISLL